MTTKLRNTVQSTFRCFFRIGGLWRFCLAGATLAISLDRASCQCPVGYANVPIFPGYNFAANPLDDGTNTLASLLTTNGGVTDGAKVFIWDVTNEVFWPPATFNKSSGTWNTNFLLPPGKGFVVYAVTGWTNTFVGNVDPCPGQTNHVLIAGTNKLSLLASSLPVSGPLTNSTYSNFQGSDGDELYLFNQTNQAYGDAVCYFTNYGWLDPSGSTNAPVLAIGQSFFIQHPGPDYDWAEWLPTQLTPDVLTTRSSLPGPEVVSLQFKSGQVILQVDQNGSRYDVQFSSDRATWSTIASNRAGPHWIGPQPPNPFGYFRVIATSGRKGAQ